LYFVATCKRPFGPLLLNKIKLHSFGASRLDSADRPQYNTVYCVSPL